MSITEHVFRQIQLDDELPKIIEGQIFIPMGVYHRVIKGNNNLKIKLTKIFQ